MKSRRAYYGWVLGALLCAFAETRLSLVSRISALADAGPIQLAQFSAWRPYQNPNRLVRVGMNKGEVLAVAGKPDREESYCQSGPGGLTLISDWYYTRTGENPETTHLRFVGDSLVTITSTPVH